MQTSSWHTRGPATARVVLIALLGAALACPAAAAPGAAPPESPPAPGAEVAASAPAVAAADRAATPPDAAGPGGRLDALVRSGLAANRALAQQRRALDRASAAVTEATGLYLPSVSINARYSRRSGNILDVGQLIDPAYAALDQILRAPVFPTDIDLKLPLAQETYLRVTQPILEPRALASRTIHAGLRDAQRGATGAAERRLACDLRERYLDYARAQRLAELYDSTAVLVGEVVRVEESLLAHGAATPDQVLRARADRDDIAQRQLDARRLVEASRQAFNLTAARPLEQPLERLGDDELALEREMPLERALASAAAGREELAQVRGAERAARGQMSLANAGYLPSLVAALDWGTQGEFYRFKPNQDYTIASLVLQWSIFDGFQREARHAGARADLERTRLAARDAAAQVELDVRTAWQATATSRLALVPARERESAARRAFEMVVRRQAAGSASLLEVLDARNACTLAAINAVLTTYDHAQRCAELERAAALYPDAAAAAGGSR